MKATSTAGAASRALPTEQAVLLVAQARLLMRAAGGRHAQQPLLRGTNFALLTDAADTPAARLFRAAVDGLGGHMAHVRPGLTEQSTPEEIERTANMLGRLYDAVECQGMPARIVRQLAQWAGVPVHDGIACDDHPSARLDGMLDDEAAGALVSDRRLALLQAVLLQGGG